MRDHGLANHGTIAGSAVMHGWRWWAICSCDCRPGGIFCAPVSLSSLCASHSLTQKQLTHTHSHTRPPTVESALSTIINILFFLCTCHAATPLHADFESGWARSLRSEPRGLAGLSVLWHAGVLARSKISGSLLHRLSRPWHGLGPGGSHRDQRYGAAPKFSSPAAGAF